MLEEKKKPCSNREKAEKRNKISSIKKFLAISLFCQLQCTNEECGAWNYTGGVER